MKTLGGGGVYMPLVLPGSYAYVKRILVHASQF